MEASHQLTTEVIADDRILLRPGLVKIWITRTNTETGEVTRFALPVQWAPEEAGELMHLIRGLAWQLSDEDNLPADYEGIRDLCHEYLYQKVGFVEPITCKWKAKNG